ncbi:N-acetylglucosamine-6-phosphate deacetylase [Corynebacterium liangguodongii]|uniref:N-acetylglucosamine-6-phosphate deacetylase n=1 Tax=Corynebacterium liangguodongii TaxID=2079535 RepID=A0A2S0WC27_9CORY|nr:N-acetylglucosamine-6-phosphate deacetylase [Corynebacterium liangguodongii]AWB83304.1 N-acetylglucosamine-6-phosphate deacetylase [Corynebacterium liangguodongii]PWC00606.1 N-acetylglucosamine-6-phosphate deacetylase [Corynebacterium liangguodongii]
MTTTLLTHATLYRGGIGEIEDDADVLLGDGRIARIGHGITPEPAWEVTDLAGAPLVPGYVDIHCHGAQCAAFDDGAGAVDKILRAHQAHGTAYQCLSLVTNGVEDMERLIGELAPVAKSNRHVLGIHPEGPFLHPSHKGAHPIDLLRDPDLGSLSRLVEAADGTIAQVTLAVERDGGLAAVDYLRERGIVASLGHTSATFEQAQAAFDAGVSILTHTFNAMNSIHHRAPGPVIAALRDPRVWLEVINDGIHVHPSVVATLFAQAPERMVLITDAMSATCAPDGPYKLGTLDVVVADGVARLKEGSSLAGSTLTMDRALAHAVTACQVPLDGAVAAATRHPAQAVGAADIAGAIAPGRDADVIVLDPATYLPAQVYVGGRRVA